MVHFIYWVMHSIVLFTNNYAPVVHVFWANKAHTFTRADITINNPQNIFLVQTYLASIYRAMMSVIQNYILFTVGNLHYSKQGKQG